MRRQAVWILAPCAIVIAAVAFALAQHGGQASVEERALAVSAGLRCPVCQNLSVADSPSRLAGEMRALIEERLRAGQSEGEVRAYFVRRYGEWILLAPRARGLGVLPWATPAVALVAGAFAWASLLRGRRGARELTRGAGG